MQVASTDDIKNRASSSSVCHGSDEVDEILGMIANDDFGAEVQAEPLMFEAGRDSDSPPGSTEPLNGHRPDATSATVLKRDISWPLLGQVSDRRPHRASLLRESHCIDERHSLGNGKQLGCRHGNAFGVATACE